MRLRNIITGVFFMALLVTALNTNAQSKKEIIKKGIEVKRIYKQDVKDGEDELYIEKEEFYNSRGDLLEMKEYADNGKKIKDWFQYKYDADGNLIEEIELNSKGEVKERIVTHYENGLKTHREYYDDKNRLKEKRAYEYEYRD